MKERIRDILSQMTLEDKIALCNGADFWHSKAMECYGIPAVTMSDGPHGLRCQKGESDMLGVNNSEPATCFPTAVTSGASWDTAVLSSSGAFPANVAEGVLELANGNLLKGLKKLSGK